LTATSWIRRAFQRSGKKSKSKKSFPEQGAGEVSVDRRRNMLIGIVAGIVIVGALSYATGLTKLIRSSFGSSAEYKSSESATAPELTAGDWINSEPLKLKDLRGRVVLIEFWTFGCINCRNTLPFVKNWADRYREKGLTVIGVHSPEFDEERNVEHLRREVSVGQAGANSLDACWRRGL
jgi:thiol-disulfide isomerase/thioredoxin